MKSYRVTIKKVIITAHEVQANNQDEAELKAVEELREMEECDYAYIDADIYFGNISIEELIEKAKANVDKILK